MKFNYRGFWIIPAVLLVGALLLPYAQAQTNAEGGTITVQAEGHGPAFFPWKATSTEKTVATSEAYPAQPACTATAAGVTFQGALQQRILGNEARTITSTFSITATDSTGQPASVDLEVWPRVMVTYPDDVASGTRLALNELKANGDHITMTLDFAVPADAIQVELGVLAILNCNGQLARVEQVFIWSQADNRFLPFINKS